MTKNGEVCKQARALLLNEYHGILSTHSVDMPGYPFGSVSPYCLDYQGRPVILISSIAQHTKNIEANPKVSLIITEGEVDDIHTAARLTLLASAEKLPDNDHDTPQRYYQYYPSAKQYHSQHNFEFYGLNIVRARFIGGFGKIHWIEAEEMLQANPFTYTEEQGMISHMNKDHENALAHYCEQADINIGAKQSPVMSGIDKEGFHLRVGERIHRFGFSEIAYDATQVRKNLVAMARI